MEYNLQHKAIIKIHVMYDYSKDDSNNKILNYLKTKNITLSFFQGRVTFAQCFDLVNKYYLNMNIILSNADIYFNDTLDCLNNFDLTNKFLCLTRWNVQSDGSLKLYMSDYSNDVWIFQTPIRKFKFDSIELGTMGCDGAIAKQADISNLIISNLCLTLQCCHLHLSNIRNFNIKNLQNSLNYQLGLKGELIILLQHCFKLIFTKKKVCY